MKYQVNTNGTVSICQAHPSFDGRFNILESEDFVYIQITGDKKEHSSYKGILDDDATFKLKYLISDIMGKIFKCDAYVEKEIEGKAELCAAFEKNKQNHRPKKNKWPETKLLIKSNGKAPTWSYEGLYREKELYAEVPKPFRDVIYAVDATALEDMFPDNEDDSVEEGLGLTYQIRKNQHGHLP